LIHQRVEVGVVQHDRGAAVSENVRNLFGREADVEGAEHAARARHRKRRLERHGGVRREHGDAIARAQAGGLQRRGQPLDAFQKRGVREAALAVDHRDLLAKDRRAAREERKRIERIEMNGHTTSR
jgi:hypothetical protein